MKKQYRNWLLIVSIVNTCLFFGCKKDDQTSNPPTGTLLFHLHTNLDSLEVEDYNTIYTLSNGRKISLSLAQLYISNIQLVQLDGTIYNVTGAILLKTFEYETFVAGQIPIGNYKSIRFSVGLDSATNLRIPSGPTDSLLNKPAMWFGSAAQPQGFIFVNLQGKIDTTVNATGSIVQMQSFSFKIGTNVNYKRVVMPDRSFTALPNQQTTIHFVIDYMKLFNGIQLNKNGNFSINNTTDNFTALGKEIGNNIPSMFYYED